MGSQVGVNLVDVHGVLWNGETKRPWWGMGDLALGGLLVLGVSILAGVVGVLSVVVADGAAAFDPNNPQSTQDLEAMFAGPTVLAIGLIGQQLAQGAWPCIVSRWKGLGLGPDFGFRVKVADLWIGLVCGVGLLFVSGAVGWITTSLVGLEEGKQAGNTQFLEENSGSAWMAVLYLGVIVGAPVTEELFFRGLAQRAFRNRLGPAWAVVLSTLLFTIVHVQVTTWQSQTVLLSSIGAIGLLLGIMAWKFDRLGPSIVAHAVVNGAAVLFLLAG